MILNFFLFVEVRFFFLKSRFFFTEALPGWGKNEVSALESQCDFALVMKAWCQLPRWRHHFIQLSMEAILACQPALSTEWLDWVARWCELWRIRTGPIASILVQASSLFLLSMQSRVWSRVGDAWSWWAIHPAQPLRRKAEEAQRHQGSLPPPRPGLLHRHHHHRNVGPRSSFSAAELQLALWGRQGQSRTGSQALCRAGLHWRRLQGHRFPRAWCSRWSSVRRLPQGNWRSKWQFCSYACYLGDACFISNLLTCRSARVCGSLMSLYKILQGSFFIFLSFIFFLFFFYYVARVLSGNLNLFMMCALLFLFHSLTALCCLFLFRIRPRSSVRRCLVSMTRWRCETASFSRPTTSSSRPSTSSPWSR